MCYRLLELSFDDVGNSQMTAIAQFHQDVKLSNKTREVLADSVMLVVLARKTCTVLLQCRVRAITAPWKGAA